MAEYVSGLLNFVAVFFIDVGVPILAVFATCAAVDANIKLQKILRERSDG